MHANAARESRSGDRARPPARGNLTFALLAGLLFLILGGWQVVASWRAAVTWPKADGIVIKNVLLSTSGYVPVVRFVAGDGHKYRFTDAVGASVARYSVGERVRVAFDPEEPSSARIVSSLWRLWLVPAVFTLLGAAIAVGCTLKLVRIALSP